VNPPRRGTYCNRSSAVHSPDFVDGPAPHAATCLGLELSFSSSPTVPFRNTNSLPHTAVPHSHLLMQRCPPTPDSLFTKKLPEHSRQIARPGRHRARAATKIEVKIRQHMFTLTRRPTCRGLPVQPGARHSQHNPSASGLVTTRLLVAACATSGRRIVSCPVLSTTPQSRTQMRRHPLEVLPERVPTTPDLRAALRMVFNSSTRGTVCSTRMPPLSPAAISTFIA